MNQKSKLKAILSCALLVLVVCSIGAVWAWGVHRVSVENVLNSRTVDTSIKEEFPSGDIVKNQAMTKEVSFTNGGTDAVFVRFTYAGYWETDTELLDGDYGVKLNWTTDFVDLWAPDDDGWYYYKQVLPEYYTTAPVLSSVSFGADTPDNATYTLLFQVETLQVSDEDAVNSDATKKVFGVEGTLTNATIKNGAVTSGSVTWDVTYTKSTDYASNGFQMTTQDGYTVYYVGDDQ